MKKFHLFILLLIPIGFISCDFLDKFDHFRAGNTFDKSFSFYISESDPSSFNGSVEFDARDDETINDNVDQISDYEVTKIGILITSFDGAISSVGNGEVKITTTDGVQIASPIVLNNVNFAQLYTSGEEIELPLNDATVLGIKEAYLANQTITIEASGNVSAQPVDVEFTISMSIEALIEI